LDKPSGAAFSNPSASELARDSENTSLTRCAGDPASASSGHSVILKNVSINSDGAAGASAPATSYSPLVTPKAAPSDWVYALKDVSFEVKRGEVLGIIGRNGAGKSTLLKILSRVTTQSEGRIKVRGRIASLLEVGTGFHPELTGRENIFLNGAILGMRKAEIARKFDEIVEFSGCARYIDTPVKRYSSGMYVRLAFAVAAHLEPEPRRQARRDRLPLAGPKGFATWDKRKPNFDRGRGLGGGRRGVPKKMPGQNEGCRRPWPHDSLCQPQYDGGEVPLQPGNYAQKRDARE
jgi:hypothetical protein